MSISHKRYSINLQEVTGRKKDPKFYVNLRVFRYDRRLQKNVFRWINIPRIFLVTKQKKDHE